jgi:hypothetical protein
MKCPHCSIEINPTFKDSYIGEDLEGHFFISTMNCPNELCKKLIVKLVSGEIQRTGQHNHYIELKTVKNEICVKPLTSSRPTVPIEVDSQFTTDYNESCLVLPFSAKASAALSRRCLQNILREKAKVKKGDLSKEIQEVIDSGTLPPYLKESIDAIRHIGNFAAHPNKSLITGEVIDVEDGEAEWLLDVIESLFDFYFVQPEKLRIKRDALNSKLSELGKPPMK